MPVFGPISRKDLVRYFTAIRIQRADVWWKT